MQSQNCALLPKKFSVTSFPLSVFQSACTVCTYMMCMLSITDSGVSEIFGCQFKRSFFTLAINGLYRIFDFLLQLLLTGLSSAVKRCERRRSAALISSRSPRFFWQPKIYSPETAPSPSFCVVLFVLRLVLLPESVEIKPQV